MKNILILMTVVIVLCSCDGTTKKKTQFENRQTAIVSEKKDTIIPNLPSVEKKVLKEAIPVEYKDQSGEPDTMYVTIENEKVMITPKGKLYKNGSLFLDFSLEDEYVPDEEDGWLSFPEIERLYFIFEKDYIVAIFTITDMDCSGSRAKRISLKNNEVVWTVKFGGFNMATPVYDDKFVYVSTIGGIYKLDYIEGTFDWKFENLYDNGKYNSFEKPEFLEGNIILFTSKRHDKEIPDTIMVDDKNRKIILKQ